MSNLDAYATASGTSCKVVADLGATLIDYRGENFARRIHELTGVDVYSTASTVRSRCARYGR
jgi:hypothetical protein